MNNSYVEAVTEFAYRALKFLRSFLLDPRNLRFFAVIIAVFMATAYVVNVTGNDNLREETFRDFSNETDDLVEEFDDMVVDVASETEDLADDIPDAALDGDEDVLQAHFLEALDDDLGDFTQQITLVHADGMGSVLDATASEEDTLWLASAEIGADDIAFDMEQVEAARESGDALWWYADNLYYAYPFEWNNNDTNSVFVITVTNETMNDMLFTRTRREDLYENTAGYALLISSETEVIAQYGSVDLEGDNLDQLLGQIADGSTDEFDVYTFDSHAFRSEESMVAASALEELAGWQVVGSIPTEEIPSVGVLDSTSELFEFSEIGGIFSDGVEDTVDYLNQDLSWLFRGLRSPIETVINAIEGRLIDTPWPVVIFGVAAVAWLVSGRGTAYIAVLGMFAIGLIGLWEDTMTTLAMLLTSMMFCIVIGIPLGIASARNERVNSIVRSILDAMQTIHPFVYLVPIVVLFGIGKVPGTIATIIFALPPMVRLTNLGIRQVPEDVVEAARSFGSNDWQLLRDVQLPLALPSIMAGVNQTLMLSLSMVVIVALIAGGGLGEEIYRAIGRADTGRAVVAGTAVLLLAVVVDRVSQGQATKKREVD